MRVAKELYLMTLYQGCTTRGPDPAPERVVSGPRGRLKIQETSAE